MIPPLPSRHDRRTILKMIAGGAAATLAACSRPDETIHPLANQPEGTLPGEVRRYATALPLGGWTRGVTGLVVDGRPIKLEGLAGHPASLGATDLFTEVSILDLYDPQRLRAPAGPSGPSSWPALARAVHEAAARDRGEGVALLTGRVTSPTLLARIAALRAALPGVRHVQWEAFGDDNALSGFGNGLVARPRWREADVIVTLGADPLGPGPEQVATARAWADRRRERPARLYAFEPSLTATGAMADVRASAGPNEWAAICGALLAAFRGGAAPALPASIAAPLAAAVRDLKAAKGRALILPGPGLPQNVQDCIGWISDSLDAPIDWRAPADPEPFQEFGFRELVDAMHRGACRALIVLDANPAYAAPPELRFVEAMAKVPLTVAATMFPNETSARATWSAPLSHPLETWHDGRAPDGTATIAQPLVRPFYDTRSAIEAVDLLADPSEGPGGHARVRETWAPLGEAGWREAVAAGVVPPGALPTPAPTPAARAVRFERPAPAVPTARFHAEIRPSPTLYDGRFSTNAWAQECPDPITKEVWGSSARMAAADMAALGVGDGDLVRVAAAHGAVTLPALAVAGQAAGVVTLLAGYGRDGTGAVADGIGANAWVLRSANAAQGLFAAVSVTRAKGRSPVISTQHQFALDGELAKLFPVVAPGDALVRPPERPTMLPNPPARDNAPAQWAMAIDTDVCIGCNACVVACQAENNVPAIGPAEMAVGRDMHWLRVDRYDNEGTTGFQPVPCMQCEAAPCEPVCPVEASIHDEQGLNLQVYNRCIGTRTCQANCPYKVRRFNFLDYAGSSLWADAGDASVTAQRNPDVTVRARGVMEKCTYCVQRVEAHNREADAGGTPAPVVTACQAACPTRAITFGPLDSPPIREARADGRHYALLEELGTKPRTTYLARRRDGGELT